MLNFMVARRRGGPAKNLVSQLRLYSKQFKAHAKDSDRQMMDEVSQQAWEVMVALFNLLRNEQDSGRLAASHMNINTAMLANNLKIAEKDEMLKKKKIDRGHPNFTPMSLRNTLNKIAHHETTEYDYRIVRGAHYLILTGPDQSRNNGPWVAEIHLTKLCDACERAINALP